MERIRVLWVADSIALNAGTERQVIDIGQHLDKKRFALHLATLEKFSSPALSESFHILNFPVTSLWSATGVWQIFRLANFVRRERIQIVHGFMVKSSIVAALVGTIAHPPVVLTSRRSLGYYYRPGYLRLVRLLNRRVTRITANSEAARLDTSRGESVSPDKIDVLYNGVDLTRFYPRGHGPSDEPAVSLPENTQIVGIVANYRPVKDLPLFLRAAAIVARQVPDAVFLLVGEGSLQKDLGNLATELGISDRVIFTAGRGAVLPYLHRMSIGCLSSVSEGFSNSILEYMAAGLPVVATNVGGNPEAVAEGNTGFLISDRTPEAFAVPIIRLLKDEGLRREMGRNAFEVCRQKFGIDVAARSFEKYYQSLVGTPANSVESQEESIV